MYGAILTAMLTTTAPAAPDWWWQFEGFGCSPYVHGGWCGWYPCGGWAGEFCYPPGYGAAEQQRPQGAGAKGGETAAHVVVKLPADARLFVDDDPCPLTGAERSFDTPDLQPGVTYRYTLRAEMTRDGRVVKETKRVTVRAGQETVAEFGDAR